jgi:hypothetical protein
MTRRELLLAPLAAQLAGSASLRISDNRRFLTYGDRRPFFYLADTAWELLHRLNRAETITYLDDRAAKGFNVIQAVALAELGGLTVPNRDGHLPLRDRNPRKPNESYFQHVDWVCAEAAKRGLFLGLLPTWGNKVIQGTHEKENEVIFDEQNALDYGRWIGGRYAKTTNILWILGGDRNPAKVIPVWRSMARGVREADTGKHLMTFHPQGRASSSQLLHHEPWLDFNMIQSGHNERNMRNDLMISHDLALMPAKPVLDGEPRYENHPIDWKPDEKGWFDEHDVRQAAYWAVFAGACGHTYGCHDVWQMKTAEREAVGFSRGDWQTSLNLPGAAQMGHLRRLIESFDYFSRDPDPLMLDDPGSGGEHMEACKGNGFGLVYTPLGQPVRLRANRLSFRRARAVWFDPRKGVRGAAENFDSSMARTFAPPGKPARGNDWVLILEARP